MNILSLFRKKNQLKPNRSIDEIKNICNVLFIDNEKFKTTERLKLNDGWRNTQWLKDIESYDQLEVKNAHILFIDIQGVGKKLCHEDEGLGLIVAIKDKYPEKKVIMYSAERKGKIDAFHKASNVADGRLKKNADHYEFQNILEKMAKELFCLEYYTIRIQKILYNDFAINMPTNEIEKNIFKIVSTKDMNKAIAKSFNITTENVSKIANIIQLFLNINQ